jgi:hypothetical protein
VHEKGLFKAVFQQGAHLRGEGRMVHKYHAGFGWHQNQH